jgi:hypothetical protein
MDELQDKTLSIEVNKHEMKGKCLTCRRGHFWFFMTWCMHPKAAGGYKAHSPFDSCEFWEIKSDFKQLKTLITIKKNKKYVEDFLKQHPEVNINGIIPSTEDRESTVSQSDTIPTDITVASPASSRIQKKV